VLCTWGKKVQLAEQALKTSSVENITPEMGVGGQPYPHFTDFRVQAVQTARVIVPPWSKDTGHPDSRLFPVKFNWRPQRGFWLL
jgi:hypothetical protein